MSPSNRVVLGDCLDVLSRLAPEAGPRFDLVYVDPPFNAGGRRGARVGQGERARGTTAYVDQWGGIDAFIAMLEPRLEAMSEVMSDRASLWLHLDHRAVHDAKVVADRVFGRGQFCGEIIWVPGNGARGRRGPSVTHQTILVYTRTRTFTWNADDPMMREPYAETSMRTHFRKKDAAGRRYRERTIGGKTYRYYADEGRQLGSVWTDCVAMNANTPLSSETTGYPTQKPEKLLERIIRVATDEGDRVLDPMCGSGTTLAVAKRLSRSFLGIDASELACETTRARLRKVRRSAHKARGPTSKRT